ncbi:MAG: hypothetical protein GX554_01625 [Elusimicrobia bacterium]|nr:hypothetical protein [Elusimicrobiota bacterium]
MIKRYLIEVHNKKDILDVFRKGMINDIKEQGISGVQDIAISDLYRIEGDISLKEIKKIAEDVLRDRIIQESFVTEGLAVQKKGYDVAIDVFYKKGVTDAVADTVSFAAKDAGITADIKVSTGKRYYIKGKITKDDIELICERLLANRLVQDYYIT